MKLLLLAALPCATLVANSPVREIRLEPGGMSGCYQENGNIVLCKMLPSQSGNGNLVIEAENARTIFYQEDVFARKPGEGADAFIQIKRPASEYEPQKDTEASGGKYIDFTSRAVYQFNIVTPGKYYVWARHWVPMVANWSYKLRIDGVKQDISLRPHIPAAKRWFWIKCDPVFLDKGSHSMAVEDLLQGKRLDAVVFSLDKNFNPDKQKLEASPMHNVKEGSVQFKSIKPVGLKKWLRLDFKQLNKGGEYDFEVLQDNRWQKINSSRLDGKGPLTVRLKLRRVNSEAPVLSAVKAVYIFDETSFLMLENSFVHIFFDRKTGALSGIVNKATGTACQPIGVKSNMFELLLKAPDSMSRSWLSQSDMALVKADASGGQVSLRWRSAKYKIDAVMIFSAGTGSEIGIEFKVVNQNPEMDVIEVVAPKLSDIKISSAAGNDTLVWPFSAGEFIRFPAAKGELSIGYPDHAGLPFADLFNAREGFYLGCHDPLVLATHFISRPNAGQDAIELSISRKHRIKAGSEQSYHYVVATHTGDWHAGADIYRRYFYSRYRVNRYRPWLRDADAWKTGGAAGHGGYVKRGKSYSEMENDFHDAAFLALPYIQAWGSTFNGACPTYYLPRLEMGGEKLMTGMIDRWRAAGGEIGFYFHGNSYSPYYTLSKTYFDVEWDKYPEKYRPPSWQWYLENKEYPVGGNGGPSADRKRMLEMTAKANSLQRDVNYQRRSGNREESFTGYNPMTWNSSAFPEFLFKWLEIYVRDFHCSTAYLDTFAFRNDRGDFNPYQKLNGEGDKPMRKIAWLDKMMRTMRTYEPDFCALTEGVADVFGTELYFLLSGFARHPNIYRYTLPDQIFFQGSSNGLWTPKLTQSSLTQAFMVGNKFDIIRIFPHTWYILKLRQRVSPFLNYSVFRDNLNIEVSDNDVVAYNFITLPETDAVISNYGSKSVALTIDNHAKKNAKISYRLPDGFKLRAAYLFELYKSPRKLEYVLKGDLVKFAAPMAETSCVVLVDQVKGPQAWSAILQQDGPDTVAVDLFNFSLEPVEYTVAADFTDKGRVLVSVPGGSRKVVKLKSKNASSSFILANVSIGAAGFSRKYVISLGPARSQIPAIPADKPVVTGKQPEKVLSRQIPVKSFRQGFEEEKYSAENPYQGQRCLKIVGNGKNKMESIPLSLKKNTSYRVTLAQRKGFNVSPVPYHNNIVVGNYDRNRKLKIYLSLGTKLNDGKWHILTGDFKTGEEVHSSKIYFYNRDSRDNVWIDDIRIDELTN